MPVQFLSTTIRSPSSDAPTSAVESSPALRGSALAFGALSSGAAPSSGPQSRVRLGSVPVTSQQELRFLQDRLALCGQIIFGISTLFLVVMATIDGLRGIGQLTGTGRAFHFLGTLIAFLLWRACSRQRLFSQRMLAALDAGATLLVCACFACMGHAAVQPWGSYTALLAVGHVTIGRAVVVPSTPQRSLLLAFGNFTGIVLFAAIGWATVSLSTGGGAVAFDAGLRNLIDALLWSLAGAALATVTSTVIYGLHEKAFEARQLGQYTLEEKIGEGSMGEIFRARHAMLRRPTAIKLMVGESSESALRRFEKEVQLTARLTHPNTISIYDYGRTPEGRFYYAMELLDGMTLEELVARSGPQPHGRVIHILRQICGALREAHGIGLIHRDIKPANIYLCSRGGSFDVVKVLDFGLVREFKNPSNVTLSNADAIAGTPMYLSPEAIITPANIDARADIYALGAVGYFLLCGSPPFSGNTLAELCGHHLHTTPQRPSERRGTAIAEDLERIVLACLAKDAVARPQSARELEEQLRGCRDAAAWSEGDAEQWWQHTSRPARPTPEPVREERRALCCADMNERLRRRRQHADAG
jgi:hypothetical protein